MLIAIIGTPCSGKSTVFQYLVQKERFIPLYINRPQSSSQIERLQDVHDLDGTTNTTAGAEILRPIDASTYPTHLTRDRRKLEFSSYQDALTYVTKNWKTNFVTEDLTAKPVVDLFVRRPFFMLVNVDAPLFARYLRSKSIRKSLSLEDFVREDDRIRFSFIPSASLKAPNPSLPDLINIRIDNTFSSVAELHSYLQVLNLPNPENLRPGWDTYFMTLAYLASQRSNCMKRRVGAVLVRENRVVATGYNGTPRGLANCNEGGCPHCNGTSDKQSYIPYECVCLHAEENALLEAGRERTGNAVLYCNTCPCLRCTVKIIQTGVKTVVYNLTYKVDEASALLFEQAGVELRRFNPDRKVHLPEISCPA